MTLKIARQPTCPGCAQPLIPKVTTFVDGWAWCQVCVSNDLPKLPAVLHATKLSWIFVHVNVDKGLTFYVPRVARSEIPTLLDLPGRDDRYDR